MIAADLPERVPFPLPSFFRILKSISCFRLTRYFTHAFVLVMVRTCMEKRDDHWFNILCRLDIILFLIIRTAFNFTILASAVLVVYFSKRSIFPVRIIFYFFLLVNFFLLNGILLVGHTTTLCDSLGFGIFALCIISTVFVLRRCVAYRREFRIIHSRMANAVIWKFYIAPSYTGLVRDLFVCYLAVCRSSFSVIRAVAPNEVIQTFGLVKLRDTCVTLSF